MRIVLLGTGAGPYVATERSRGGAAILVQTESDLLLFDCGRGAVQQLADAGYSTLDVSRLFFTHLHSGHTVGYPDFVLSSWVGGLTAAHLARTDFKTYGPVGTRHLTEALFGRDGAFITDLRGMCDSALARREFAIHRHRISLEWPAVHVVEVRDPIGPGVIVAKGEWQVRGTFVSQGLSHFPCLAYRIDANGRSVVISGDTCPTAGLISMARGADLLIHDGGWSDQQLRERELTASHTGAGAAADLAAAAGVKTLVLTSIPPVNDEAVAVDRLAEEARQRFAGNVEVARDLMTLDV